MAPDGTSCNLSQCIINGLCKGGVCVNATPAPDNTFCATGNACTTGDSCQKGICVAGKAITCSSTDKCLVPSCDPKSGCVFKYICDGGAPDLTMMSDMIAPPVDGEPGDLPPDAHRPDRGCNGCDGEFADGEVPDGESGDGGPPGDGAVDLAPPGHVHGSGCSCEVGGGSDGAGAATALAALIVAMGVRRRRRR